jgi:hypothetical protein
MKRLNVRPVYLILIFLFFIPDSPLAKNTTESVEVAGGTAEIIFLEGKVTLLNKGISLNKGDSLSPGDRIETAENTRVELKLPDGSFIRFDEKTTFELISAVLDHEKKERDIRISMILGKTWAKVSKLFGRRGRFELATKTAVCGVRGTVYRMNVNPDNSVMVRVYWGEIVVNTKKQADTVDATASPQQFKTPSKVMGPEPISGPHPVSQEEWTYIVKALQQINIQPDGTAMKPFRFDIKEDLNDWVRWNQERDEIRGN